MLGPLTNWQTHRLIDRERDGGTLVLARLDGSDVAEDAEWATECWALCCT